MSLDEVKCICTQLQEKLENRIGNLSGACYLFGHLLNKIYTSRGYKSRKVTGSLRLLMSEKCEKRTCDIKYVLYGNRPSDQDYHCDRYKYHTWCEVKINNDTYIIDPSIKYNRKRLSRDSILIHEEIEDVITTANKISPFYKYEENSSLDRYSEWWLQELEMRKPELSQFILKEFGIVPQTASRGSSRNKPCPCGSGKKSKNCCNK
ncbi:SEC-C metal-binding domain-containing protein [Candidatus Riflebacteria bacterium]